MKQAISKILIVVSLGFFALATLTYAGKGTVVAPSTSPNLKFCDDRLVMSTGTLCAIKPSNIDSRTLDMSQDTGVLGDNIFGFGYHVFAVPKNWSAAKGVWVHFGGSYSRPYNQNNDTYQSDIWLNELMEQGYAVLQVAYDNRFSVNGDLCGVNNPGYNRDNCAGEVREIGLTGNGYSPYRATDQYNTIDFRLKTLVGYIEDTKKISLPDTISSSVIDWTQLDISGHSQGAGQVYYISRLREVASVCILAGVYDTADTVNPGSENIADWFLAGSVATPVSRFGAMITETDTSYNAFNLTLLNILKLLTTQVIVDTTDPYQDATGATINGHAATIKDPSLKNSRALACF